MIGDGSIAETRRPTDGRREIKTTKNIQESISNPLSPIEECESKKKKKKATPGQHVQRKRKR
jgi:hypothetical protein